MIFQVQDIVVGNKNLTDVTKPSEIVQLLLNDEQLASLDSSSNLPTTSSGQNEDQQKQNVQVRDMWNDDGDDFFGHTVVPSVDRVDDNATPVPRATRGKGRKANASRGRKPGPKKKGKAKGAAFDDSIY